MARTQVSEFCEGAQKKCPENETITMYLYQDVNLPRVLLYYYFLGVYFYICLVPLVGFCCSLNRFGDGKAGAPFIRCTQ